MARRKTPRPPRRRPPAKRGGARRSRARSAVARRKTGAARKSTARSARASARKRVRLRKVSSGQARVRKASARQSRLRKPSARQARPRKGSARQAHPGKASASPARLRKASEGQAEKAARKTAPRAPRKAVAAPKAPPQPAARSGVVARKAPALNRERRIVFDDAVVPTPPSSLDLDRSASAVRSGRRELHERFVEHTETSPAITGGDIDADWESAYSVGDEAPGGDNPTPDQDIVDDIGRAVGVEYEDNEELKGETKIAERDRKRWELDPASSEDYDER